MKLVFRLSELTGFGGDWIYGKVDVMTENDEGSTAPTPVFILEIPLPQNTSRTVAQTRDLMLSAAQELLSPAGVERLTGEVITGVELR